MTVRYNAVLVMTTVHAERERLFSPWLVGRPATYACDQATKDLIATSYWLDEELRRLGVNDVDRITQCSKYNRQSRSYDVWETAAECLNEVLDGKVEQNRKPHRRWG